MKNLSKHLSEVLIEWAIDCKLEGDITQIDTDLLLLDVFTKQVDELLMNEYGVTIDDCTNKMEIEQEFNDGTEADHFVRYIGSKYDLTPIKE
jgi:hypothetical protein